MQAAARSTLSNLVEEHLTSLVRDATSVRRHAKRARFAPDGDVGASPPGGGGNLVGAEGENGGGGAGDFGGGLRGRPLLHSDDVNLALSWRGSERIYATGAGGVASSPSSVPGAGPAQPGGGAPPGRPGGGVVPPPAASAAPSAASVYLPDNSGGDSDRPVDLNAYLRSENRVRPPSETWLTGHWLAVDGVQPDVPENPPPPIVYPSDADGAGMGGGGGRLVRRGPDGVVHRVEDDEEREALLGSAGPSDDKKDGKSGGSGSVSVRHLLPRLLSEELRLYFSRVTLAIERGGPAQQDAALVSVGKDSGVQELVPFFVRFVSRQIYDNLGRADRCRVLVRLAAKLVGNPHVHLELHLHQMLPAIITCVVARRLASSPIGEDDHWSLREEAARSLVLSCVKFGDRYATLRARVLRTLCEALGPDRPLPTRYGGIVGLALFGPRAVDAFLLPVATAYWEKWEAALGAEGDEGKRFEIRQCQTALLNALGVFLSSVTTQEQATRLDSDALSDVFGERLIPLRAGGADPSDYVSCVL